MGMVSPYLMKPLRSLREAAEGKRVGDAVRGQSQTFSLALEPRSTLKVEGRGVHFWDSRTPTDQRPRPRLVWTNAEPGPTRNR